MKSYLIHLIRHGIAEGNLQGRYIGTTDSPLAPQGIEQLRRQKEAGGYPGAEVYYTSPLRRCVQTLRILYPDASPVVVEDLRECDFGDWEGKTAKELEHDETFLRWMEGKEKVSPPNGESSPVFMHRVCAAFEKLVEGMLRSGTTSAVVVTHGGAIMTLLSAYGLPRAKFYDWMTDNGCGYTLRI
ncbi:MAG TPA: histidine phosphatase family protein, partial [Ruminococcaceae bacterium]|nr:histidine phosphatase family protein [Oscillospiraceae bacterium]